ncbi:MAG TPA: cell wall-binding repeat-containing protein [Acidimicrobiales bacterium]|nr:cell wall-binding repeat-containing protein [Acidimicrobiales bacterium]
MGPLGVFVWTAAGVVQVAPPAGGPTLAAAALPRVSADGSKVAFLGFDGTNWNVDTYDVATGTVAVLGQAQPNGMASMPPSYDSTLSISADGSRVLWTTSPDPNSMTGAVPTGDLLLSTAGAAPATIATGPAGLLAGSLSPDGTTAAVTSTLAESGLDWAPATDCASCPAVFAIDLTGQAPSWTRVTASGANPTAGAPSASDQASTVAFADYVDGLGIAQHRETTPPSWPAGSTLTPGDVGSGVVALSWTPASDPQGVTGYRVFANGHQVDEVPGTQLSDQAGGLVPNTVYTFTVQAGNDSGNWSTDGPSAQATTTASDGGASAALSAKAQPGGAVALSWTPTTDTSIVKYRILRGADPAKPAAVADVPVSQHTYTDAGLPASTHFTYVVDAVDASGNEHPYTLPATATTPDLSLGGVDWSGQQVQGGALTYGSTLSLVARGDTGRSATVTATYTLPAGAAAPNVAAGGAAAPLTTTVTLDEDPNSPGTYRGSLPLAGMATVQSLVATLSDGAGGHSVTASARRLPAPVSGAVKVTFDTTKSLAGDLVTVLSGAGTGGSGVVGDDGSATVPVMAAPDYQVNVYDSAGDNLGQASAVAVGAGALVPVSITPTFATAATITLQDSHGNPIPYQWVPLVDQSGSYVASAPTGPDGVVQFNNLTSGVQVRLGQMYLPWTLDEDAPAAWTQTLSDDPKQNVWTVKTVAPPEGTVAGLVTDAGGKPFPGAHVAVDQQVGGRAEHFDATTGADGRYTMTALAGDGTLQVTSGDAIASAAITVPTNDTLTKDLQLKVPVPVKVRVNIYTKPAGAPSYPSQPLSLDWRASAHLGFNLSAGAGQVSSWSQDLPAIGTEPTDPGYNMVTVSASIGDPVKACTDSASGDYKVRDGCATGTLAAPVSQDQVQAPPTGTSGCYADTTGTTCALYLSAAASLTGTVVGEDGKPTSYSWTAQVCKVDSGACDAVGSPIAGWGSSFSDTTLPSAGTYQVVVTSGPLTAVGTTDVADGGLGDLGNLVMHPASHFTGADAAVTGASSVLPGGTVVLTARFPNAGGDLADLVAHLHVPKGTTIDPQSLVADGKAVTGTPGANTVDFDLGPAAANQVHLLTYQLTAGSDVAAGTHLVAQATATYTGSQQEEFLRQGDVYVSGTTLDLPSTVTDTNVTVAGRAPAGWTVTILSNGATVGSAVASKPGAFYTVPNVDLANKGPKTDGETFSLVAKATPPAGTPGDAISSPARLVTYDGGQATATSVTIWENEDGKRRGLHTFDPRQTPNYFPFVIVPGQDFYMQVTVDHPELVDTLWTSVGSLSAQAAAQPDGTFLARYSNDTNNSIGFGGFGKLGLNIIQKVTPIDVSPASGGADQFQALLPPGLRNMTVVSNTTGSDGSHHLALNLPGNTDTSNPDLVVDFSSDTTPTTYTPTAADVTSGQATGSPFIGVQATLNPDGSIPNDMTVSWLLPVQTAASGVRGALLAHGLPSWIAQPIDWAKGQVANLPVVKQVMQIKESDAFKKVMDSQPVKAGKAVMKAVGVISGVTSVINDVATAQSSVENDPLMDQLTNLYQNRNCPQSVVDRINQEVATQAVGDALSNVSGAAFDLLGLFGGDGFGAKAISALKTPLDFLRETARASSLLRMGSLVDDNCQPDPKSPDGKSLHDPSNPLNPNPPGGGDDSDTIADPTGVYDPSGTLYEGVLSNPVAGATATILYSATKDGPWTPWNASGFGQANPETTDSSGAFAWDTPTGWWKVEFTKAGYRTVDSPAVQVLPPQLGINVGMVALAAPTVKSVTADTKGITLVFSQYMNVASVKNSLSVTGGGNPVDGTVAATDAANNPAGTAMATTFRFTPTAALTAGSSYSVTVSRLAQNYAQSILGQDAIQAVTVPASSPGGSPGPGGGGTGGGQGKPMAPGTTPGAFSQVFTTASTDPHGGLSVRIPGSGTTVTLAVPDGALPANTVVTIWKGADTVVAGLLHGGDRYITSYAVSWTAPDGSTTTANGVPLTLTVDDQSIHAGDLVYRDGGNGVLVPVTAQVTPGEMIITFTSDPGFVVVRPTGAHRIGGIDRDSTAVVASQAGFPTDHSARSVVLARSDDFADALAGVPLAVAQGGPLLLTPGTALDPVTATEISRVAPAGSTVYLLGGTRALSPAVESAVAALGYKVVRLSGSDRYATSVAVAGVLGNPSTVVLATGHDFADALAGGPLAASLHGALILVDGDHQGTAAAAYLAANPASKVYALGGPAAAADAAATPIVGPDRYGTAAMVAGYFFSTTTGAGLASGLNFPDALAGGVRSAEMGWPVLLTDPAALSAPAAQFLGGGPAAVGDQVVSDANGAVTPKS